MLTFQAGQPSLSSCVSKAAKSGFFPLDDTYFAVFCKKSRCFSWQNERFSVTLQSKSKEQMKNTANRFWGFYYYFYFSR